MSLANRGTEIRRVQLGGRVVGDPLGDPAGISSLGASGSHWAEKYRTLWQM